MEQLTRETSLKEAKRQLENAVYKAALIYEQLEHLGLVMGNGHHAAQKLAAYAAGDLESRWIGPAVSPPTGG